MTTSRTHQGRTITLFGKTFIITADYVITLGPGTPGISNGARLGFTVQEMADIADMRARWDAGIKLYNNKKDTRTTLVKDDLKLIIKEFVEYDKKHHLTNRVASNPIATTEDYVAFNILQGTSLAKTTHSRASVPGSKRVVIALKEIGHLFHTLSVTSPDLKGRGKEEGVNQILFYKAITLPTAAAPAFKSFEYINNVKNGKITITHSDELLGQKAWYIACVENTLGEKGVPTEAIGFIII